VDNDNDNKEKTEERIQQGCRKRTKAKYKHPNWMFLTLCD